MKTYRFFAAKFVLRATAGVWFAVTSALSAASAATVRELYEAGKITAEGAAVTWSEEDDLILQFTDTTATGHFTLPGYAQVWVLAVGGGGAGGNGASAEASGYSGRGAGGGGGGGGFVETNGLVLAGGTFDITVGAGGTQAVAVATLTNGDNGRPSLLQLDGVDQIPPALGGGGGGAELAGNPGGSGGGGSQTKGVSAGNDGGASTQTGAGALGHAGGRGKGQSSAGGGGGAGAPGADATGASKSGVGGDGTNSWITGSEVWYAGGGGGGTRGSGTIYAGGKGGGGQGASTKNEEADMYGTDGLGGGGGGNSRTRPGGKGGSGVVIVRIREALDGSLTVPEALGPFTYDGSNHVGVASSFAYDLSDEWCATNAGVHNCGVTPKPGFKWIDGTSDKKIVQWWINQQEVPVPAPLTGLIYTGEAQDCFATPVSDARFSFVKGSVTNAVNAGTYAYTVRLADKDNYCWAIESKSVSDQKVFWTIAPKTIDLPDVRTDLVYGGTNQCAVVLTGDEPYACGEGSVTNATNAGDYAFHLDLLNPEGVTNYVWNTEPKTSDRQTLEWSIAPKSIARPKTYDEAASGPLYYGGTNVAYLLEWGEGYELAPLSVTNATDADDYAFTLALDNPEGVTNYVWSTEPPSADDWTVDWSILQAENWFETCRMSGWMVGQTPREPSCTVRFGQASVKYDWATSATSDVWIAWNDEKPESVGSYAMRFAVDETPNWSGVTQYVAFAIWGSPSEVLVDYVDIDVPGSGGETLQDIPVLLRLSETRLPGFTYARAGDDGQGLAFTDASGALLSYDIDFWDTAGESTVWVKIPSLPPAGTRIRMYWCVLAGQTPPGPDAADVWSAYAAVWHMSDANATDSAHAASGRLGPCAQVVASVTDPSGKACPAIGRACGMTGSSRTGAVLTATASSQIAALTTGSKGFTVSFWAFLNRQLQNSAFLFSRKKNDRFYNGYGMQFNGNSGGGTGTTAGTRIWVDGDNTIDFNWPMANPVGYWARFDVVYSNGYHSVRMTKLTGEEFYERQDGYANQGGDAEFSIGGLVGDDTASAIDGYIDEFRLMPGCLSKARLDAERDMITNETYYTHEPVVSGGEVQNYWIVEPYIAPRWDGVLPTEDDINHGTPRLGTVETVYRSLYDDSYESATLPTSVGVYGAYFTVDAGEGVSRLEKMVEFTIVGHAPYDDVGEVQDGRLLLMNRDHKKSGRRNNPESGPQGWFNADNDTVGGIACQHSANESLFWHHCNEDVANDGNGLYNLMPGTESVLWTRNRAQKLWHLFECRHGNTFETGDACTNPLLSDQVYLPWSSTSMRIDNNDTSAQADLPNTNAKKRRYVGQLLMRNTRAAEIYSPCYTNGIGTIYFDAANGWVPDGRYIVPDEQSEAPFQIAVDICTNVLDMTLPPTDENISWSWEEGGVMVTDEYYFAEWHPVAVSALEVVGTTATNVPSATNFTLNITTGGGQDRFYRIVMPLNIECPARFRIRRTGCVASDQLDLRTLILLDNIVVSPPPMWAEIKPCGWLDAAKRGKLVLGQESAFDPAFPATGEAIYGRGEAVYHFNSATNAEPESFITTAAMYYRWRYLEQEVGDWQKVSLNPLDGLYALDALTLPDRVGDVEFYYDFDVCAPYYSYVDYSGLTVDGEDLGTPGYTEEISHVTSRASLARQASCGTDWYVRLREGASDYERVIVRVRAPDGSVTIDPVDCELVGNHIWRGFVPTVATTKLTSLECRLEGHNRQEPGMTIFICNTNYWQLLTPSAAKAVPISSEIGEGDTNSWFTVPCDSATGYLMFQVDDENDTLTVNHADYQNFNAWTDSSSRDYNFIGTSVADASKVGTSREKRSYTETFETWEPDTPAENAYWREYFEVLDPESGYGGYGLYEPFTETSGGVETPNGWYSGPGMWVCGRYHDPLTGMALQMQGQGKGYLAFSDSGVSPRGIERITFKARLAQAIDFTDFQYYYGGLTSRLPGYLFLARVNFDAHSNSNFCGNASLSLVANYNPSWGCYEARWEQLNQERNANGDKLLGEYTRTGPNLKSPTSSSNMGGARQRLCIYRWSRNGSGMIKPELLCATTNNFGNLVNHPYFSYQMPNASGTALNKGYYMPMFISVTNTVLNGVQSVIVAAGVKKCTGASFNSRRGITAAQAESLLTDGTEDWCGIMYRDGSSKKRTSGSFGVLACNCEGLFVRPEVNSKPILPGDVGLSSVPGAMTVGAKYPFGNKSLARIGQGTWTTFKDELSDGGNSWFIDDFRMSYLSREDSAEVYGLQALIPTQRIDVLLSPVGEERWSAAGTATVSGFGSASSLGDTFTFNLWEVADMSMKLQVKGSDDDYRTDIVVDDVELRQWRGDDYGSDDTVAYCADDAEYGWRTNFVFTSGWVNEHAVTLSAKRTAVGKPCSLRGPLLDGLGRPTRGLGLGLISFDYVYAQTNVNLLVQVATNVTGTLAGITQEVDDGSWTTVTNFSFAGLSAKELASGSRSCYLGLHGVQGAARILMDPDVVADVKDVTDRSAFGEITITKIFMRDEPNLDISSWWGWNLRGFGYIDGSESPYGDDDGRFSYLPDMSLTVGEEAGLSLALNNSVTDRIRQDDAALYPEHMPFLQTPTFASNVVGEVMFKARRFDSPNQYAEVTLYGATSGDLEDDRNWHALAHFVVSNDWFETYAWRSENDNYRAFRFGVTGVRGVTLGTREEGYMPRGPAPTEGLTPVRVLLDEVIVCEAVRPQMGFVYCLPFRENLAGNGVIEDILSPDEQPLLGEPFSIQAKIRATQLPDELDLTTPGREPRVILHWYASEIPWGYENWKKKSGAHTVELALADDGAYVYRGGYAKNSDAVIDLESMGYYRIVQYVADAIYYNTRGTCYTNRLSSSDWETPYWYHPVDKNAEHAAAYDGAFSAYTILEKIAPGRVWFNEVNLFDGYENYQYSGLDYQYVEIAVPYRQDITGWRLDYINSSLVTNNLCVYGSGDVAATKTANATNEYVFITVQNPKTREAGVLDPEDGQVDGTWTDFNGTGGTLKNTEPIALRLVRPTGVVEQEIVLEGTNTWTTYRASLAAKYSATNFVAKLLKYDPDGGWYYVGDDTGPSDHSLGVVTGTGAAKSDWTHDMTKTPGRCNQRQIIPEGYVISPNGSRLVVYAKLLGDRHVRQLFGEATEYVSADLVATTPKGGEGTNILYRVDKWYEIKSLTTNGIEVSEYAGASGDFVFAAGRGLSNNVTVVASTQPNKALREIHGITEDNPYRNAIMDWLEKGKDLDGNDFENDTVTTNAWYMDLAGNLVTNLTLTQRYWLDIDPTASNWVFQAGVLKAPEWKTKSILTYTNSEPVYIEESTLEMTVKCVITNTETHEAHSPYCLRGLEPGVDSSGYPDAFDSNWTSVTFKVTADLQNGMPYRARWVPLRWFVFTPDSFTDEHTAVIGVRDPMDENTGLTPGWSAYKDYPVFYRWSLDSTLSPYTVEALKADSSL